MRVADLGHSSYVMCGRSAATLAGRLKSEVYDPKAGDRTSPYLLGPPIMSCGSSVIEEVAPSPDFASAISWFFPTDFTR